MGPAYRHIFGPLSSKRLGISLGINTIPLKTCNLDCAYCQLGTAPPASMGRRDLLDPYEILDEMSDAVCRYQQALDTITFAGEGEPTLCRSLGKLIRHAKLMSSLPVALITNGTLFWQEDVRNDARSADIVIPSLDAADARTFERINRPHHGLGIERIVEGMAAFRRTYRGELRVEVMLISGINDSDASLAALREALRRIQPDMIYLNLPLRPTAEEGMTGSRTDRIKRAWEMFRDICTVEQGFGAGKRLRVGMDADGVRRLARSHPIQMDEAVRSVGERNVLMGLIEEGEVTKVGSPNQGFIGGSRPSV